MAKTSTAFGYTKSSTLRIGFEAAAAARIERVQSRTGNRRVWTHKGRA